MSDLCISYACCWPQTDFLGYERESAVLRSESTSAAAALFIAFAFVAGQCE